MNILEIAKAMGSGLKTEVIGIRPGEKLHAQMIGLADAPYTYESDKYFKILPIINDWSVSANRIQDGKKCKLTLLMISKQIENGCQTLHLKIGLRGTYLKCGCINYIYVKPI